MKTMDTTIRHYKPSDQNDVFTIAADTAFFGEPVEAFLDDRTLFRDAYARFYTEHETPYAWVAEVPLGVTGFLFGCADTSRQVKQWRKHIVSKVMMRALTGKYRIGRLTAHFAWSMLVGMIRGEEPKVDFEEYPAHLQIDVRHGYRGMGIGRGLIGAYLDQLGQLGVGGVHLSTTSHNVAACLLYEKIGFKLLDSRPNRFWTRRVGFAVENRTYGLKLSHEVAIPESQ